VVPDDDGLGGEDCPPYDLGHLPHFRLYTLQHLALDEEGNIRGFGTLVKRPVNPDPDRLGIFACKQRQILDLDLELVLPHHHLADDPDHVPALCLRVRPHARLDKCRSVLGPRLVHDGEDRRAARLLDLSDLALYPDGLPDLPPDLRETDGSRLLLHHLHGVDRDRDLFEVDVPVAADVEHPNEDAVALPVRRAHVALVNEPFHPVIQLDERAKVGKTLDTPDVCLSHFHIAEVAARAHAVDRDIRIFHIDQRAGNRGPVPLENPS